MTGVMEVVGAEREVEVVAKAQRRRFTAEYERRILREADGCKQPGTGQANVWSIISVDAVSARREAIDPSAGFLHNGGIVEDPWRP